MAKAEEQAKSIWWTQTGSKSPAPAMPRQKAGRVIDSLNKLLDNYESLESIFDPTTLEFYDSSDMEHAWYLAMQDYIEGIQSWAAAVGTVLSSAGRHEDSQSWNTARESQAKVTIGTVGPYAERLRILLEQIRSRIEQEYNYAPDLAQVTRTPLLSERDISDAYRMSELYIILHCYENSVRRLIEEVLSTELGEDWWEKAASASMKNFVEGRKQTEQRKRWLSPRGGTPLYYLEWGDLVKLIRKYENLFLPRIGSLRFVEGRFEELEALRNIVAHNGVLPSDDDFQRVIISFRDWCHQIED